MIEIEKGVPIPSGDGRGRKAGELLTAIRAMVVTDSFVVDKKLRSRMASLFQRSGMRCKTKALPDDNTKVRVWRIA